MNRARGSRGSEERGVDAAAAVAMPGKHTLVEAIQRMAPAAAAAQGVQAAAAHGISGPGVALPHAHPRDGGPWLLPPPPSSSRLAPPPQASAPPQPASASPQPGTPVPQSGATSSAPPKADNESWAVFDD